MILRRISALVILLSVIFCAHHSRGDIINDAMDKLGQAVSQDSGSIAPNNYWYVNDGGNDVASGTRGTYYEYREYLIYFSAEPCEADIYWNGKQIGSTPFKYLFTGKLYTDENLLIKAMPRDSRYSMRKARINLYGPLPRRIHFDFTRD
jgi:hypothetical protein